MNITLNAYEVEKAILDYLGKQLNKEIEVSYMEVFAKDFRACSIKNTKHMEESSTVEIYIEGIK